MAKGIGDVTEGEKDSRNQTKMKGIGLQKLLGNLGLGERRVFYFEQEGNFAYAPASLRSLTMSGRVGFQLGTVLCAGTYFCRKT